MEHLLTCVWRLPRVNGVVGLRWIEMLTLYNLLTVPPQGFTMSNSSTYMKLIIAR